mgnify:CR=1 FL=1
MKMLFQEKIEQLEIAYKERDIDKQLDIVEELLTSGDNDIQFHVDNALSYNCQIWLQFTFDLDIDELREKLDEVVELLLDYNEKDNQYQEYDEELDFKENLLDYHKEFERLAFGVADDYAKGFEYEEITDEDLDY